MKQPARWIAGIMLVAAFLAGRAWAGEVRVFAAASLADALEAGAAEFARETGDKMVFNFAASSLLARQIMEGAPADVYFSADEAWMDTLAAKGLIEPGTRRTPAGNSLVVVVPGDAGTELKTLADLGSSRVRRIALADPRSVPAGRYAEALLREKKLWAAVEPKVIPMDNVRAALAAVESGDADAAIVYKTDALISKKARVVVEIPRGEGPDIRYAVAVVKGAASGAAARTAVEFFSGDKAAKIFGRFGFAAPGKSPR